MKCSDLSTGSLGVIEVCLRDILQDKSSNTLLQTLEMMESQIDMIKQLEGLKK